MCPFVEQEVQKEYGNLQNSHRIHTQSASAPLEKWHRPLRYENINGNDALPRLPDGNYDYSSFKYQVSSHVDFAKLYVENHMAKFNAFDERCSASVVLVLLGNVPVFPYDVQSAAGAVRKARNAWGHCEFSDWSLENYKRRFSDMIKLVKALHLLPAIERNLLSELRDWETKGTMLCMNATVDPDLLKLVQEHVNTLKTDVEQSKFEVEGHREQVIQVLANIFICLEALKARVDSMQCEQDIMKQEQSLLSKKMDTLQTDHDTTQVQFQTLQAQLGSVIEHREDRSYEGPANVVSQQYFTTLCVEIASCEGDIAFFAKRHDPDTRQWFFDDFDAWFRDPGDSRAYVLLGDPAVGKSVMTAVLAQRMRRAGHLLATYFCRHNDGTRNDPRYLLGTVACQICECNSQYNTIVGGEGRVRNLLGNSKLGVQELFTKLLQEPLAKFNHNEQRKLVIIDALDETEYESREDFLDLIMHRFPLLPEWLVFFITSRPEDSVQFRLKKYNPCVKICAGISGQHNFYQQHEQDIRTFLKKRVDFSRLSCTVEDILKQCNGLFLYAHYIVEELRLSMDLNKLTDLFPGGINDFFLQNFKRVYDQVGKDIFKKLFGCAVVAPSRLPVSIISYILKREKSNHDEQQVIDAVSQFVVLRRPDYTLAFLHDLIPVWLTDNKKASRKLFIDKKIAGEYLRTIFVEILFSVVYEPRPTVPSIDDDLGQYVWRVAVRFLCQNGNKDWLKTVFSCLTSYHLMERRMQSGRKQIYHLLDDFRFVVGRFPLEEIKKQEILQGISFALESNVFVLLECPHLLHACIRNTSNAVRETVLIRQMSGPWLEWSVYALSDANIADMYCLATSPNKRTVVGARRRSLQFFDASTAKVVGGPFEVSDDLIDDIEQLEFSPDGKFIFFGRLDKWFSVERGCVEDFPQFFGNSHIYKWGVFTRDGKSIVVKRNFLFNRSTCQGKSCLFNLLALWAVKEIEQSRSDEMTVYFSPQVLCNAPGVQIKILFELLEMGTILNQTLETLALYDPSCHYCCRLKQLTESSQEASLAAVRQLVLKLYPCIFNYQVWDLQSGMTVLQQVFSHGVELNPFTYLCHVTCAFSECGLKMMCCGIEKAMSVCNIAAVTATCYALFGSFYFWHGLELELELEREMKKVWQLEILERKQGRELELEWCLAQIPEPEKTQEQEKATRLERLFQQERDFDRKQIREQDRDHFQKQVLKLVQQRELKRDWMPDMKQVHDQARKLERELKGLWELKWVQELRQERELEQLLEREQERKGKNPKLEWLKSEVQDLKLEHVRRHVCGLTGELLSQRTMLEKEQKWLWESHRKQLWNQVLEVVHQWEQGQVWKLKWERERENEMEKRLSREQKWEQLVGQMQKLLQQRKLGHEWVQDLKQVRYLEQELELKQAMKPARVRQLNWVVQRLEQKWKLEMQRKRKWERLVSTGLFKEFHNETFKFGVCRNIPKGFQDLVYNVNGEIRLCMSPETKWMIEASDLLKLRFLQAGIQDGHLNHHGKSEHTISKFTHFTFTDDDLYLVYSCEGSLHALCLQTGTILTSVTGCNLYYFRREKQVGYLFRSDTQERAIFLTNLFSPFKFVPVSPVKPSVVGKSIAAMFHSSDNVMSVSSDFMVTFWQTSANEEAIAFMYKSLLTASGPHKLDVKNCVLSSDGKLIAIHQGSKVELYSFAEPGVQQFLYSVFESKCKFTVACFAFSADSAFLLFCIRNSTGDSHFYEWNIQGKVISDSFKSPVLQSVECCCLSSSKRELMLCGEYHIEIWDYAQRPFRLLTRLTVEKPYNSATFRQCLISLDNQVLACCIADLILVYSLYASDIDSSKQVLRGHLGRIEFCRFIKRNRYLISYGVDGMVFLWDISEAKAVGFARIAEDQDSIVSMAVSPEEDRAVCFTSSDRMCVIKLCALGSARSLKPLMVPLKGKEATVETSLQLSEQIASSSQILLSSVEDDTFESLSSSDSEEDMDFNDLE